MITECQKRPRLIILTQFYDPEPAYKGQAFAEAIRDLGYDVEVVTGFPNYPSGKLYDGYRIYPMQRSTHNGIRITRLALYPSHGTSKIGRVANYLSFFLSAFLYLSWAARRADLVYVYSPPLTAGLAAAASKIIHRTPVVVDIHASRDRHDLKSPNPALDRQGRGLDVSQGTVYCPTHPRLPREAS